MRSPRSLPPPTGAPLSAPLTAGPPNRLPLTPPPSPPGLAPPTGSHFTLLPEDFQLIFAQYYGNIQVLSARNALFQTLSAMGVDSMSKLSWFEPDTVHPQALGHRAYADILIHMFQTYVREQVIRRREASAPTASKVMDQLYVLPVVEAPLLPEPLNLHNYELSGGFCSMNEDLRQHVQLPSAGWDWVDEGFTLPNGLQHHKYGYVSTTPGSVLTMVMDTTLGGFARPEGVQLMLAYLKSYGNMGSARLSCLSGCTCTPTLVNGTASINYSLTSFVARTVSPSPACIVAVENVFESAAASAAGRTKFKVLGLALHENSEAQQQYLFSIDHDNFDDDKSG